MFNLLAVLPNIEDATSLYRGSGPLAALRREMDINLIFSPSMGENQLELVDAIFMQRPSSDAHLALATMAHQNGVPIWLDYDDLLMQVPESNPAYDLYSDRKVQQNIAKMMSLATVITVSTDQLKMCIQSKEHPLNNRVYTVPNALAERFLPQARQHRLTKHVNWRGTNTHQEDLMDYGAELIDLYEKHDDATFVFIGYNPWFITRRMPGDRAMIVPPMSIGEYFRFMSQTNPSTQIVPLASSMFNLCKSNIAWLEGCLTGAVTIAPDWPEWHRPGILNFKSGDEFRAQVDYALKNPERMHKLHKDGWDYIRETQMLSQINKTRVEIANSLYALSRGRATTWPAGGEPITPGAPNDQEANAQQSIPNGEQAGNEPVETVLTVVS